MNDELKALIIEAVGATYKISRYEPINLNMVTNGTLSVVFNNYYEELAGCKMKI